VIVLIGELAGRFGLAAHVLRHWEDEGLLAPERVNGRRTYGDHHAVRVAMILRGKAAGLRLDQLRAVLDAPGGASRRELLREHRDALDERIRELAASRELIDHVLHCEAEDFTRCPVFIRLVASLEDGAAPHYC